MTRGWQEERREVTPTLREPSSLMLPSQAVNHSHGSDVGWVQLWFLGKISGAALMGEHTIVCGPHRGIFV